MAQLVRPSNRQPRSLEAVHLPQVKTARVKVTFHWTAGRSPLGLKLVDKAAKNAAKGGHQDIDFGFRSGRIGRAKGVESKALQPSFCTWASHLIICPYREAWSSEKVKTKFGSSRVLGRKATIRGGCLRVRFTRVRFRVASWPQLPCEVLRQSEVSKEWKKIIEEVTIPIPVPNEP